MKIYLLHDIPKTGQKGSVLEVSEGYGRYLLKQKQASFVTPEILKKLEAQKRKELEKNESELQKMQTLAAKLDGEEIEVAGGERAGEGTFYAAIGQKEIAQAIKKHLGVLVTANQIKIPRPMKEAGDHKILVSFGHGLEAELTVIVS